MNSGDTPLDCFAVIDDTYNVDLSSSSSNEVVNNEHVNFSDTPLPMADDILYPRDQFFYFIRHFMDF